MSWSLFRITSVDTEPLVKELRRLADAAEIRLRLEHNYHLTPPRPIASAKVGEEPTVAYTTDESTALNEFREEFERMAGKSVEEDEEETK